MNLSWMVRLYPQTWREQHGAEFRDLLGDHPASIADALDLAFGALNAHVRNDDAPAKIAQGRAPHPSLFAVGHPSPSWMQLFFAHTGLYVLTMIVLAVINLLVDRDNLWMLYPLWGWGMVWLGHLGLTWPWRNLLGAHLLLTLWIGAGLIAINRATSDGDAWAFWPVMAGVLALTVHAIASFRRLTALETHAVGTAAVGLALAVVAIANPGVTGDMVEAMFYLVAALGIHWSTDRRDANLMQLHLIAFVVINTALLIDSVLIEGHNAFIYPLVAWSILLAAHLLVHHRLLRGASTPEAELRARIERGDVPAAGLWEALLRERGLLVHLALFGLVVVEFGVLNLMTGGGFWMVWPIGVASVLLAGHIGFTALRTYSLLGAHIGAGGAAALGLFAINASQGGGPWSIWPISAWLVLVAVHVGVSASGGHLLYRAHVLATVVAMVALLLLVGVGVADGWIIWPIWGLLIALGLHSGWVALPEQPGLGIWLCGGGAIVGGLVVLDLSQDGTPWAFWPAIVWVIGSVVAFGLTVDLLGMVAEDDERRRREQVDGAQ